jgi:ATPase subunit of ABC transporter with duplicated ATPase domains
MEGISVLLSLFSNLLPRRVLSVTSLMLLFGLRRYGLLGLNGCGKSTLLTAIGCRELPIPEHMDIYHLSHEIEASDMSALQAVVCCDEERVKLEKEAEILSTQVSFLSSTRY